MCGACVVWLALSCASNTSQIGVDGGRSSDKSSQRGKGPPGEKQGRCRGVWIGREGAESKETMTRGG